MTRHSQSRCATEFRAAHAHVGTKVLKDPGGKRVTGVNYTNVLNGEEFEQPASIVILTAYRHQQRAPDAALEIGRPYDPASRKGRDRQELLLPDGRVGDALLRGRHFNPFMNAAGRARPSTTSTRTGISTAAARFTSAVSSSPVRSIRPLPIGYRPVPSGTPSWGTAWKPPRPSGTRPRCRST